MIKYVDWYWPWTSYYTSTYRLNSKNVIISFQWPNPPRHWTFCQGWLQPNPAWITLIIPSVCQIHSYDTTEKIKMDNLQKSRTILDVFNVETYPDNHCPQRMRLYTSHVLACCHLHQDVKHEKSFSSELQWNNKGLSEDLNQRGWSSFDHSTEPCHTSRREFVDAPWTPSTPHDRRIMVHIPIYRITYAINPWFLTISSMSALVSRVRAWTSVRVQST